VSKEMSGETKIVKMLQKTTNGARQKFFTEMTRNSQEKFWQGILEQADSL
jgi:hypothetical protein